MSKARIYARNLLANWIGHGANLAVMFFLSPYIVHTLGKTEYGIWNLLVSLTGSMGLFDLGIRASTERHIILHTGRGQFNLVNDTIRASLGFFSAMGVGLLVLGFGLGWAFPSMFRDVPSNHREVVQILLPLLAGNIWLMAVSAIFGGVLVAHDRYDLVQAINLGMLAVRTGGTVMALGLGFGLPGLVVATIGAQLVSLVGNYVMARKTFPQMAIWPFWVSRGRVKELIGYGVAAFISAVAYRIIHQTDLFVVGALTTISLVAVYAVGAMLPEYLWGFVHQVSQTFFPPIQRAYVQNDLPYVHRLFIRQARMSLLIGIPLYVGILTFGGRFLRLWLGQSGLSTDDLAQASIVMAILCGSRLVFLSGQGAAPLLSAIGHIRLNAVLAVIEAVINVVLSVAFVACLHWGVGGVAMGTLVGMILFKGIIHPWYACRLSKLSIRLYVRRTLAPGFVAGGMFYAWCFMARSLSPNMGWGGLMLEVAMAVIVYVPIGFLLLVDDIDRRRILRVAGLLPAGRETREQWGETLP